MARRKLRPRATAGGAAQSAPPTGVLSGRLTLRRAPMTRPPAAVALVLALALTAVAAAADEEGEGKLESDFYYRYVRTPNLNLVYYDENQAYIVPHLSKCFENSFQFHKRLFDYTPSGPVTVHLQDFDDYGYAGTSTIPYNYITIGIEPFEQVFDTCPTNESINWVMSHELVHVVCTDQSTAADDFFRTIFFGKVSPTDEDPVSMLYSYLASPRYYAPRWYHEGIAVFLETYMAGGIGRAQSGYDEMVFRTMVRDGTPFYDIVGLESEGKTIDFQTGRVSYLYGTRFVSYLAYEYGPERLIEWFRRAEGSRRYFSAQFRHVYGTPLDDEWRKWIAWEHEWQRANLDSIREYPRTPYRTLSDRALGSVSRAYVDPERRKLYAAVEYPGEFPHIAEIDIDTGERRKICDIATTATYYVTHLAHDPATRSLFYTTHNARGWRDIWRVDIETGERDEVLHKGRIGDLAFSKPDGALWGVQHHLGQSRLVRLPPPYNRWQEILVLPYGKDLFDIDVSPDGRYISACLIEISGRQWLIRLDAQRLVFGDSTYEILWEFPMNAPANFVFSEDGKHLYGTSYLTGTSNVFRYSFADSAMSALSNAETGFFRPTPAFQDSLIVFRYTGNGFVPAMIPDQSIEDVRRVRYLGYAIEQRHPIVRDWVVGSPLDVEIDSLDVSSGTYSALANLRLGSAYPIAEGYKDHPAFGARLNFIDPALTNALDLAVSYSPDRDLPEDERLHVRTKYRHGRWTLNGAYNRANFYDFFGPTKSSRKGYSLGLNYNHQLIADTPVALTYGLGATGYWGLEKLPDAQNVATSYDNFATGSARLSLSRLSSTIGGIEAEKGVMWQIAANGTHVLRELHPRFHTNLIYGFLLPIEHSSIWLHTSFGYSPGDREEPFDNFYFGGFGNNWIDHAGVNRYRQFYSFPGMELNSIGGTNYAKAMLEWTLPPVRFKRLGFPALYSNWARLAVFSSGIVTNLDADHEWRSELVNVGAQLNVKLVVFSSLESTLSFGYAVAAEEGWAPEDELMISLKILR
jgi:hypothetical protein